MRLIVVVLEGLKKERKMKKIKEVFLNLLCPAVTYGAITGIITAVIVLLFKFVAKYVISFSEDAYLFLRDNLYFVPLVLGALFGVAYLFARIYKKQPRVRGGGIPSSIALIRNIVTFKWLRTLIGVFFMSLTSFLVGVPLGPEGPSVLMGTAVGKGCTSLMAKRRPAWSGYAMTGGACAGFAVATGASVSGVMFAIEEAHQKISPMILIVATTSVLVAQIVSRVISPLLGLSLSFFPNISIVALSIKDIWIPLVLGVVMGVFAVVFLKYYHLISKIFTVKLKRIPHHVRIFIVFVLTLAFGLVSFSFVSTGHDLFPRLLDGSFAIVGLAVLLLVRMTLTLFANTNKLTGGVFVPFIVLGAILSAIIARCIGKVIDFDGYYTITLMLGITACISSMMKMPLTAIVLSIEVLGCANNVLFVITVVAVSYIVTEIFGVKGINDSIIDNLVRAQEETQERKTVDTHITIKKGSFAEHKHARDVLWPANLLLLSITPSKTRKTQTDPQMAKAFHEGDVLHIRYSTFSEEQTRSEIVAIAGEQDFAEVVPAQENDLQEIKE